MVTREQVSKAFLGAAAKAYMKDYDELASNLELDIHKDLHGESIHAMAIVAALEDELDVEIDANDLSDNVTTLESGIEYVTSICNGS